jgi:hypothetical protein
MTVVMFHSGGSLPDYLKYTFKQFRLFNPNVTVYFITDHIWMSDPVFSLYNINVIDKRECTSDDIHTFEVLYGRGENDFWTITTTRLMYIANFITTRNLHDVYHFENDVLIYFDIESYHPIFIHSYQNLAITYGGPDKVMTGMMFIKNPKALSHMTTFILGLLHQYKVREIRRRYGMDMVNEMTLMRVYTKEYPGLMVPLPTLPFAECSVGFDKFQSIFDPASWGQYVGGTPDGIPGVKPEDHYIGQLLRAHLDYTVVWKNGDGRKVPYFRYDCKDVKINNLHIHSKNLHLYMSNE